MKNIFKSLIIAVALSAFSMTPKAAEAQDQPVTIQTFYDQLSPYGQWVNYPNYGYVFIPNAGPGFIPYSTAGHWEYTDQFGWTWDSDYPWGWACFHYGRWNFDPSYGWFWVPDTEWGPAWVVWRNSDQYYGWAPLPSGVDISMGINNGYGISPDHWCFVPTMYMGDPQIGIHFMPRINNDIFIMHTAFIMRMNYDNGHRYSFFAGPDRYEVERYRHNPIQPVVINFNSDPHHAYGPHELGIYRPSSMDHHDDGHHDNGGDHHDAPAPARVVTVQQMPQRGGNYNQQQQHIAPQQATQANVRGNNTHAVNIAPPQNNGGNRGGNNNGGGNNRGGGSNNGGNNDHHH